MIATVQNTRRGSAPAAPGGPTAGRPTPAAPLVAEGRIARYKRYLGEVRGELNKVVWPTRKETTSTTLVVFLMVVAVSIFLWLVDSILALLVQAIIG
ncbi:MAG: preprotein translocase subunit SecE [Magnetococcales bacterium]|nr:preprotein translocase subunit SecE [Magnetococcales bacterium]